MKMNFPTGILVAVAGLAIGYLSARSVAADDAAAGAGDARSRASRSAQVGAERNGRDGGEARQGTGHDLAALQLLLKTKGPGPDYGPHMERLTAAELRDLLAELSALDAGATTGSPFHAVPAMAAAARELYHREGMAAVEWANSLPRKNGGMEIWREMILAAVVDAPESAEPWVARYQKEQMPGAWNPFIEAAVRAASAEGVDAILRLRDVFGDSLHQTECATGPVPDDFDFTRLVQEFRGAGRLDMPIHLWAGKDPEAAWSYLSKINTTDGGLVSRHFNSLFTGLSQTMGEKAAARWLVSRLGELPEYSRTRAVFSMLDSHDMRHEVVGPLMAELPGDADRVALAIGAITPYAGDEPLKILQSLDSETVRVEAVIGAAKVFSRAANFPDHPEAKTITAYFTNLMDQLNLSSTDRERVQEVLRTPQDPFR